MLDWFTTIPGILIICGVILLLIAIILFVVGSRKTKKSDSASISVSNAEVTPLGINNTVMDTAAPNMDNTVMNTVATPNVDNTVMNTVATSNVDNTVMDTVAAPSVDTAVMNTVAAPSVDNTVMNTVATPNVDNVSSVIGDNFVAATTLGDTIQVQEPQQELFASNFIDSEPIIENSVVDMPSFPQVPVQETDNSAVYGGNTPVVNFNIPEEKPISIYGGNDPLEATQSLPKMEINHEPYGGNYPEARIVEPAMPIEVPTPVEETIMPMSTMQPTVENNSEQSVIEIPDLDSTPVETSTISSVAEQNIANSELIAQQQPIVIEEL